MLKISVFFVIVSNIAYRLNPVTFHKLQCPLSFGKELNTMNSVNLLFGNKTINQSLRFSQILSQSLESVSYSLQEFATSPEFMEKMRLAFGDSFVTVTALNLAQDWQKGSITGLPLRFLLLRPLMVLMPDMLVGQRRFIYLKNFSVRIPFQ